MKIATSEDVAAAVVAVHKHLPRVPDEVMRLLSPQAHRAIMSACSYPGEVPVMPSDIIAHLVLRLESAEQELEAARCHLTNGRRSG